MPAGKYASGRTEFTGWSREHELPISYPPAPYRGAVLFAEDGKLHYSDGDEWIPLLEQNIDRPAGRAPSTAEEQTQLRLSPYFSRRGLLHTGTRFEVSSTEAFAPGDILFTREIDDPVEFYQIVEDDGLSYGQEFYWRGIYISEGQESDPSIPLLQQYPKEIQDPSAITPSAENADIIRITPFETAFSTRFAYTNLETEIYADDGTGNPGNLLYEISLSGEFGGNGEIDVSSFILEDGSRYYWKSRYKGQDIVGGGAVTSEWTDIRYFFPIPTSIVLTFDTNIGENGKTIALPLFNNDNSPESVAVSVDWGDGSAAEFVNTEGWVLHEYSSHGEYTVKIDGTLPRYGDSSFGSYLASQSKLRAVNAIGENMGLVSLSHAFHDCYNLIIAPRQIPSGLTNLYRTFKNCPSFNADISDWDTSEVTSMYQTFMGDVNFNQPIGKWDVSNVSEMSRMLSGCSAFDQPLNTWNMSGVAEISYLFENCIEFNQDISNWSLNTANDATGVFKGCVKFNKDINNWGNTFRPLNTSEMFYGAEKFNQPLDNWDMLINIDMSHMFRQAKKFNKDISSWNTGSCLNMRYMFSEAEDFDQDLSSWDVTSVNDISYMFHKAYNFNSSLAWVNFAPNNIEGVFLKATSFNQDVSGWDVSQVGNMYRVFEGAISFNQDISSWDVSAVGTTGDLTGGFAQMFREASAFDQDLSAWAPRVANAYTMDNMFRGARAVNATNSIGVENWLVTGHRCSSTKTMFYGCPAFDADLSNWDMSPVTDTSFMFAYCTTFNNAEAAGIGAWDMSNVTNMQRMFLYAETFNQDISAWNTSACTDMNNMFHAARKFNQPIGTWNVQLVKNVWHMFYGAFDFNQNLDNWFQAGNALTEAGGMFRVASAFNNGDVNGGSSAPGIGNWDMSGVEEFRYMFSSAAAFNQNIGTWDTSSGITFDHMFDRASKFNQDISGFEVGLCENFVNMFFNATAFDQNIGSWDVSNGKQFTNMFWGANVFNQDISVWNTSKAEAMNGMFGYARSFNQNISSWDTSSVIDMTEMFYNAENFNQNLGNWDIGKVDNMNLMFDASVSGQEPPLSTDNYTNTLIGWLSNATGGPREGVTFHAGTATYNPSAQAARDSLVGPVLEGGYGWNITDGGPA